MNTKHKPTIVVVAFNRVDSINRILFSLSQAVVPPNTRLIVSIDNNGKNRDVVDAAEKFEWKNGSKEVLYREKRMGLRNHIISCGDFTYKYGSIILLEDDIFVSPHFYSFASQALDYYESDERIAGISSYKIPYAEANKLPFIPLEDDSDVFFMKFPSSIGQAWTEKHWHGFREWYNKKPKINSMDIIPPAVNLWPRHSWKKFFVGYTALHNKYFVYPSFSYVTNFTDAGINMVSTSFYLQVPIRMKERPVKFKDFDDAVNVYDIYSEILPDRLNRLTNILENYDYEVDLYGRREKYTKEYVLTSRLCEDPILTFDRNMKPHEMNVIQNLPGDEIRLAKSSNIIMEERSVADYLMEQNYFYKSVYTTPEIMDILKHRLKRKVQKIIGKGEDNQ